MSLIDYDPVGQVLFYEFYIMEVILVLLLALVYIYITVIFSLLRVTGAGRLRDGLRL
mgnify:CR=1 FL=1